MGEKKEYKKDIDCDNCGVMITINIPSGTRVTDHIEDTEIKCTNCECRIEKEGG